METFAKVYAGFLTDLRNFAKELTENFTKKAPSALQHFRLVPDILPENDSEFYTNTEDRIISKVKFVINVTKGVISKINIDEWLCEGSTELFSNRRRKIEWWMNSLHMAMATLMLTEDCAPISILAGGISGVNIGVNCGMDREVNIIQNNELPAALVMPGRMTNSNIFVITRVLLGMEMFIIIYCKFHEETTIFCDHLIQKFKKASPSELQDVRLIPSILPTSDFDITTRNNKEIVTKFQVVHLMMHTVRHFIKPFVEETSNLWLQHQCKTMKWWADLCYLSLGHVAVDGKKVKLEILPAGIGGVSIGSPSGELPKILKKMQKLEKVIRAGPNKTIVSSKI